MVSEQDQMKGPEPMTDDAVALDLVEQRPLVGALEAELPLAGPHKPALSATVLVSDSGGTDKLHTPLAEPPPLQ